MEKEKRFRYNDYYVCRADLDKLNEIDNKLGALSERLDLSADMVTKDDIDDKYKKQLLTFISTTYPNTRNALMESKATILKKYKNMPKPVTIEKGKRLLCTLIIISVIFAALFIANHIDNKKATEKMYNRLVYVSTKNKTYHFDDYCVKLSSLDKKEKITLKTATNRDYEPCGICCK